jgi:protein-disulfide isomerase
MNSSNRPTRSEQREEARAKAKAMREQHKKSERRKGVLIKASVGLAVVAVAAIIAFVVIGGLNGNVNSNQSDTPINQTTNNGYLIGANGAMFTATSTPTPAPNPGGVALPAGAPVKIVTYVDYQCPYCAMFEAANTDQIKGWLDTGIATLEIRPLSFLDGRGSPNEYSSRAANAAHCVASYSPDKFFEYNYALFKNQPAEGVAGPDNQSLFDRAKSIGVKNENSIHDCVMGKAYGKWITKTTSATLDSGVPEYSATFWKDNHGTPAVFVNGKYYEGAVDNAAAFAQFVQQIAAGN